MSTFLELLSISCKKPINRCRLLVLFWLLWPGSIIIVGMIFESRTVPLLRYQSIVFMPGGLLIGVMLVSVITAKLKTKKMVKWWNSQIWWFVVLFSMAIIGYFLHTNDIASYSPRSACSPTKVLHDVLGYFIIPSVLVGLGIPEIISYAAFPRRNKKASRWLMVLIGAILAFTVLFVFDNMREITPYDIEQRHPSNWEPLWETTQIIPLE